MGLKQVIKRIGQIGYFGLCQITVPVKYNNAHKNGELRYLSDEDFAIWKKAMLKMLGGHVKAGYASRLNEELPAFAGSSLFASIQQTEICKCVFRGRGSQRA